MNRIKLMAVLLSVTCCFIVPQYAIASTYTGNDAQLAQAEISQRKKEISSRYEVGEYLSDEDAAFIKQCISADEGCSPASDLEGSINISETQYGVSVSAYGTAYYEVTDVLSRAYGANANVIVNSGSTPKSMTLTVYCTAYGLGMDGAPFVVYKGSVPATATGVRYFSASPRATFSGATVLIDITTTLSVTTSSGSTFTVESS